MDKYEGHTLFQVNGACPFFTPVEEKHLCNDGVSVRLEGGEQMRFDYFYGSEDAELF